MNGVLLDPFRHHAWATRRLLEFCRGLPAEQLTGATATGGYSTITETFHHIVMGDARYLRRLRGAGPAWMEESGLDPGDVDESSLSIDELLSRAADTAQLWEQLLAEPFDPERILLLDQGTFECPAGVIVAQALHHGSLHREQICAIVTGLGLEPLDLQPWAYAEDTGRARIRKG